MTQPPASPSASGRPALDRAMLEDYLNQHLLGSGPGVPAFRAAVDTWRGTPQEAELARIAQGVRQSQDRLRRLIRELGCRTPLAQRAARTVAAAGGRLNPVNALRSRGSGWTQVELDVLVGALAGQAEMWRTLEGLAPHVPGLDAAEMRRMLEHTLILQDGVRRVTDATALERFLGDRPAD